MLKMIVLIIAAFIFWIYAHHKFDETFGDDITETVVCTAETMQCPNGIYVDRSGPYCEFVCP